MAQYSDLVTAISMTHRPIDEEKIRRAYEYSFLAHDGQMRRTGEPYIEHPTQTAVTLCQWGMDTDTICAGLLHDAVEDGGATREDLVTLFGEDVARLVDGVTKVSNIRLKGNQDQEFVENLRKMILVMAEDLRVVFVKLADRLHNMHTLIGLLPHKRRRFAHETMDVYAPLAERLGIGFLKGELEDLAFPYVYPKEYVWTTNLAQPKLKHANKVLEGVRKTILETLSKSSFADYKVMLRQKHWYSLYQKLLRDDHDKDLSKIHDLMALRIIVSTDEQCYLVLGMIHQLFRPVTSLGVRDFVANPKPNGYRSIHTNVFTPDGGILEVQIRTQEMHELAEYGLAAHWHYGDIKNRGVDDLVLERGTIPGKKLEWVKELVEWQKEITDHEEYLRALRFDALQHRQLVFSPKGDVFDLPRGATPLDYAYAVHTDLGNRVGQAKVNGKLVPLSHKLDNGDVVEILPDKRRKKPSQNWIDHVVTTHARKSIRRWG